MRTRVLEAAFRHIWLLLLPPMLMPLVVTPLAVLLTGSYETRAAIWVDRPTYFRASNDDLGRMTTPAQSQSARLNQLLRSRTFLMSVAEQTPLAPLVGSTKGEDRIHEIVDKGLLVTPSGDNLISISFQATSPAISFQVVDQLLQKFQERGDVDQQGQADQAISFYEDRLQSAEDRLAKSNEALRRYVASNPRLAASDRSSAVAATTAGRPSDASVVDPRLGELQARVDLDGRDVDRARSSLDDAHFNVSATAQGQALGFQVIDPPQMPTEPRRSLRKLMIFPAAAVVAGFGLSAVLLLLLVGMDRSVRSASDLSSRLPVVAVLPTLAFAQTQLVADPDVARHSVELIATNALSVPLRNEDHGPQA